MQPAPNRHSTQGDEQEPQATEAMGHALRSTLDMPLAALRASLESLARELGEDPRTAGVDRALDEVSRAGQVVRDLADFAATPAPLPLACTIDEIVYSARLRLTREERDRVSVANSLKGRRVYLDGPMLSGVLERLLRNAAEANDGEILITARATNRAGEQRIKITVVNGAGAATPDPEWACAPFHTSKPKHLGLGLTIASRDVELLDGSLTVSRTPRGEIVATVDLPASEVQRPNAEI